MWRHPVLDKQFGVLALNPLQKFVFVDALRNVGKICFVLGYIEIPRPKHDNFIFRISNAKSFVSSRQFDYFLWCLHILSLKTLSAFLA